MGHCFLNNTGRQKVEVLVYLRFIAFGGPSSQLDAGLVEDLAQTYLALWLRRKYTSTTRS